MERYFKIGEMAKMFNMNIRTLRYYDEISLLHPIYVDADTNYRYYSIDQFEQLNTIRYLRAQGVSVDDIRTILNHRDPKRIAELLRRQQENISLQIKQLKETQARLAARVEQIEDVMDPTFIELLRLENKPERPIVASDFSWYTGDDLEIPLRQLENASRMAPSYFLGKVGISMPLKNLKRGSLIHYHKVFCLPDPGETTGPIKESLPSGKWAMWRFRGTHAEAAEHWERLLQMLKERNLEPVGDGIEFALVDFGLTECTEDFITELQVPVAPISSSYNY